MGEDMKVVIPLSFGFCMGLVFGICWKHTQINMQLLEVVRNEVAHVNVLEQKISMLDIQIRAMKNVQQQDRWR